MLETVIRQLWNGESATPGEHLTLSARLEPQRLVIEVDAPFHDDPPPAAPRGRCDGLWEFEVVELFLVGEGERYLEIELGPHGHYLLLELCGPRRVVRSDLACTYDVSRRGARWSGRAEIRIDLVPPGLRCWNAFAIHGRGSDRRYLAAHALPGTHPDFHRIADFPGLP